MWKGYPWWLLFWPGFGLIGAVLGVIQYVRRGGKTVSGIIGQVFIGLIFGNLFGPFALALMIHDVASFRPTQSQQAKPKPPPET
jgi:flagellar motor component MotA